MTVASCSRAHAWRCLYVLLEAFKGGELLSRGLKRGGGPENARFYKCVIAGFVGYRRVECRETAMLAGAIASMADKEFRCGLDRICQPERAALFVTGRRLEGMVRRRPMPIPSRGLCEDCLGFRQIDVSEFNLHQSPSTQCLRLGSALAHVISLISVSIVELDAVRHHDKSPSHSMRSERALSLRSVSALQGFLLGSDFGFKQSAVRTKRGAIT